jgi:hypothetical protein
LNTPNGIKIGELPTRRKNGRNIEIVGTNNVQKSTARMASSSPEQIAMLLRRRMFCPVRQAPRDQKNAVTFIWWTAKATPIM